MEWRNKLLRSEDIAQLEANHREQLPLKGTRKERDFKPVAKLFNPVGAGTWLLTELEPGTSLSFGLADLGMGCPEMGTICLDELWSVRLPFGMKIERDIHFTAQHTLSEYSREAQKLGYIKA